MNINIELIENFLERINIDLDINDKYFFILFYIQRVQLISNLITILKNNKKENNFILSLKYNLINFKDYELITKKIKNFKKYFEKNELISEVIDFIKKSMGIDTIKTPLLNYNKNDDTILDEFSDTDQESIEKLLKNFKNLDNFIKEIDNNIFIEDNDIYSYIQFNILELDLGDEKVKESLNKDITRLNKKWDAYLKKGNKNKNHKLYLFFKDIL